MTSRWMTCIFSTGIAPFLIGSGMGNQAFGTAWNNQGQAAIVSRVSHQSTASQETRTEKTIPMTSIHFLNEPVLRAVDFPSQSTGFVGGDGRVLETINGGRTWGTLYSGTETIDSVSAVNQDQVFAVSDVHLFLIQSDGSIHKVTLPQITGGESSIPPTVQTTDGHAAFVLKGGTLYRYSESTNAFHNCSPRTRVTSFAFQNAEHGYAVSNTEVLKTTDGGRTWSVLYKASAKSNLPWKSQLVVRGSHIAVLFYGADEAMSQQAFILYESNNLGSTWRAIYSEGYFSMDYNGVPVAEPSAVGQQPGPFTLMADGEILATAVDWNVEECTLTKLSPSGTLQSHTIIGTNDKVLDFDWFQNQPAISSVNGREIFVVGGKNKHAVVEESRDGGKTWNAL